MSQIIPPSVRTFAGQIIAVLPDAGFTSVVVETHGSTIQLKEKRSTHIDLKHLTWGGREIWCVKPEDLRSIDRLTYLSRIFPPQWRQRVRLDFGNCRASIFDSDATTRFALYLLGKKLSETFPTNVAKESVVQ